MLTLRSDFHFLSLILSFSNCGFSHSAASTNCPAYERESKTLEFCTTQNLPSKDEGRGTCRNSRLSSCLLPNARPYPYHQHRLRALMIRTTNLPFSKSHLCSWYGMSLLPLLYQLLYLFYGNKAFPLFPEFLYSLGGPLAHK